MTLQYAILGFLSWEPLSGYDLKTRYFDGSVAYFFPANQKQIYRTLEKLETLGWAVSTLEIQENRPNRREYQITPEGRTALQAWLCDSSTIERHKFPFLVQLYFGRYAEPQTLLNLLTDQLRQHRERLATYQTIDLPDLDDLNIPLADKFGAFTLDFGRRFEQMQIDWLEQILAIAQQSMALENS